MKLDKYIIRTKETQYRQIMSENKNIKISDLVLNTGQIEGLPKNPRFIRNERFESLKKSIQDAPEMLDYRRLAVYPFNGKYVILCGNMRFRACKELGYKEMPCYVLPTETPAKVLREWVVKDNVAFGEIDTELLTEWDATELQEWGMELPEWNDYDDKDFGEEIVAQRLADRFIVPPFDVFDAKAKDWLERKRMWKSLIKNKAQARESARVYCNQALNDKEKYKGNGVMENDVSIFDPVLAEIILQWFTPNEQSNVFDCFAGGTEIGYVAATKGHNFCGIELRQEQADFNNERTKDLTAKYICDDGQNVLNHLQEKTQDLFFSCPPYFDLEVYSDLPNDASNQKEYKDFLKILDNAFTNACRCLKDDRFAVVVCGDVRDKKSGAYYNFPNDIVNIFTKSGFSLYNNIKLLTPFGNAQIRAARYMQSRKTVHVYQDVLVFYKGNTKNIKDIFSKIEVKEIDECRELE